MSCLKMALGMREGSYSKETQRDGTDKFQKCD
jgi:hypothetical protein